MKTEAAKARIHVPYNAPLDVGDTAEQTMGCRATSPLICKKYGLPDCAYINADRICRLPPRGWKKHFLALKEEDEGHVS